MPKFDQLDIVDAIDEELAEAQDSVVFTIEARERVGDVWRLQVRPPDGTSNSLDEGLEGQSAWWPGPPKGAADVLSVVPDELQLNLRFATREPPAPGERIFVYPPKYLEALKVAWTDSSWVGRCEEWFQRATSGNRFDDRHVTDAGSSTRPLRSAQRAAFALTGWSVGFLWGPPGTGKTYTLGALLAAYLRQFPDRRVLLLSTTNGAVDQALLGVDQALESYGASAAPLRKRCQRVGNHFVGGRYIGREHLLPTKNPELVRRLTELESRRPNPEEVIAYASWKREIDHVRALLRTKANDVLIGARLAAVTTTAATFLLTTLREQVRYDLVVFDEASQVGMVHASALAPLGIRALFAGDPYQLSPIVQSQRDAPLRWLGQSMFVAMREDAPSTCLLNEQSRMAGPICAVVSGAFYEKRLVVADDAQRDASWIEWRNTGGGHRWDTPHVCIEPNLEPGSWSRTFGGPIRYSSTEWVLAHISQLVGEIGEDRVIVLTPFRAQRALMRRRLREHGFGGVRVNTVHRAQGTEEHTVIFDAVDGASDFFRKLGDRLINVALSRAQARLVLLFSQADLENPKLRQVAELARLGAHRTRVKADPVDRWVSDPNFPACLLGRLVSIGMAVGEVQEADSTEVLLRDASSGELRRFKTAVLRKMSKRALTSPSDVASSSTSSESPPASTRKRSNSPGTVVVRRRPDGARLVKPTSTDDRTGGAATNILHHAEANAAAQSLHGEIVRNADEAFEARLRRFPEDLPVYLDRLAFLIERGMPERRARLIAQREADRRMASSLRKGNWGRE